ncbi:polyphosphate kinase [Fulvivirgaceae bacterium BMA10]|uniref:Polyphosphate kinase n=1 Tax=Splendidivirga corallicola TaxID=3051826 RepID=A0ABT8KQE4_9BACT|nr:polyphosphate kinase [Fulvivirgaceae bacterium BMA10]
MSKYNLSKTSTRAPEKLDKLEIKEKTLEYIARIDELQNILYAESKWSLLIVLQGMDASGKDGAVREVFSAMNPQGVMVKSFKKPTKEELSHDFLWRVHKYVPKRGMIQIFNRSHYEDVLVTRVKGIIDDDTARKRFRLINSFEDLLNEANTKILKFYLHISKEEQKERFQDRLNNPRKHWKFNPEDLKTSENWGEYEKYYEEVFENCGKKIPWIIVPSDQNWYKEYIIAKTIVKTLESLNLKYPKLQFNE